MQVGQGVSNIKVGLIDQFSITDELLNKEVFSAFLLECMDARGSPHLKQFFAKAIVNGVLVFSGDWVVAKGV